MKILYFLIIFFTLSFKVKSDEEIPSLSLNGSNLSKNLTTYIQINVDPCSENPCQNNGTCVVDNNGFNCSCELPYFGKTCELVNLHSGKGGSCYKISRGNWNCDCKPGYGKYNGYFVYYCKECDCGIGASCTWDEGYFKDDKFCHCADGRKLTNEKCKGPCRATICENGGKCENVDGAHYKCNCRYPFFGKKCEMRPCSNDVCKNGGTCKMVHSEIKCDCKYQYFGDRCEKGPCSPDPCKNGGICNVHGSSYKCNCSAPYVGKTCENDLCTNNPCKNGGTCKLHGKSFKCDCPMPYLGKTCENDVCSNNPCHNNGHCKIEGETFKCMCPSPYLGKICNIDLCTTNPCKNGGICELEGEHFKCNCPSNFLGDICENEFCHDKTCLNGACEMSENTFTCKCNDGFTGTRCENKITQYNYIYLIIYGVLGLILIGFVLGLTYFTLRMCRLKRARENRQENAKCSDLSVEKPQKQLEKI